MASYTAENSDRWEEQDMGRPCLGVLRTCFICCIYALYVASRVFELP